MTVPDLLARAGHPLGSRGRTRCPLHAGAKNMSEFSYTDEGFFCFSCGAKGGIRALLSGLRGGVDLDGFDDGLGIGTRWEPSRNLQRWEERASSRLFAALEARHDRTELLGVLLHRMCEQVLGEARRLLDRAGRLSGHEDARAWALEHAAGALTEATALRDRLDWLLGCECRDAA